jgi:mono/diheme cytochrome c family protein
MRPLFFFLGSLIALSGTAFAQQAGDAASGRGVAEDLCSDCHAIDGSVAVSPNGSAPTFIQVANTPGMTALALTVFFQTPHQTMPNVILPAAAIRDLTAYILSLED